MRRGDDMSSSKMTHLPDHDHEFVKDDSLTDEADLAVILDFIRGGRIPKGTAHPASKRGHRRMSLLVRGRGKMKFQIGRFTCEVLLDGGKLKIEWLPEPPKYLSRDEREQYQAGIAAFLDTLRDDQRARIARPNGGG
jgi:hypothetical protein